MGQAFYGLNEFDEAEEHYRGVVASVPKSRRFVVDSTPPSIELGEAYLGLSKIAKQDTRLEEALEFGEKSVAVFRANPLSWNRVRALAHYQSILHVMGDNKQADLLDTEIKLARKALKIPSIN
jgi:tetratricopeptide (TPR) repeat protein